MSDFEDLVRQTGFLLKTDVGQGAQDLVLTVSALGLTGTQVASLNEVEAAGFVKADRLRQAEALLARTKAKLEALDANHTALRGDHARKLEAIARAHEAQLAELNARLEAGRDEARRLSDLAHHVQAERDRLTQAMEKARPGIERLLAENQHLKSTAEALRGELARVNAGHGRTQQALEACQAQLKAWRDEG